MSCFLSILSVSLELTLSAVNVFHLHLHLYLFLSAVAFIFQSAIFAPRRVFFCLCSKHLRIFLRTPCPFLFFPALYVHISGAFTVEYLIRSVFHSSFCGDERIKS